MPSGQRELPNDFEAEQAVLGSLLISKEALAEVIGQLTSEEFYHQAHRLIYAGMMALYDMNQPVDVTTLTAYLRDMNQLEKMGYQVINVRTNDQSIGLVDRAKEANATNADIFISLHHNAYNGAVSGIESFYY